MRIGFIGLGTMGASMAGNLQRAGHELVVHDTRPEAARSHLAAGAIWAATPRAVAEQADPIFSSLPGPAETEIVGLGNDGLITAIKPDAAWFDLTTNAPATVRRLHAAFAEKGAHVLDAPVSGGPRGAATGKLAIWVGGDRAQFDRYK
ncbi:MAG: NAD(P)-dependent oxidoreductase, partial [Acetobacteraceae bacterium]|nr:NAD(P)-dependent oxidoreductase [Acetobacteraceae bacterium]